MTYIMRFFAVLLCSLAVFSGWMPPANADSKALEAYPTPRIVTGQASAASGCVVNIRGGEVHLLPLKCLDDESRLAIVIRGHLKDMVSNGKATCVLLARDMAGRRYGQCMLEGQDIAAKMIEAGWGIVIPRSADTAAFHQLLEAYDTLERHARAAGYGIWARSGQ